jgi:hypothetical protein
VEQYPIQRDMRNMPLQGGFGFCRGRSNHGYHQEDEDRLVTERSGTGRVIRPQAGMSVCITINALKKLSIFHGFIG